LTLRVRARVVKIKNSILKGVVGKPRRGVFKTRIEQGDPRKSFAT